MSAFEYFFSFYALLLGLALANAVIGFADVWRSRKEVKLGFCIPLLALVIVTFSASKWHAIWNSHESLPYPQGLLLIMLTELLPYIFISQAMFPKTPEAWPNLDEYYLAHRGTLLGALIFSAASVLATNFLLSFPVGLGDLFRVLFTIVAPAIALLVTNKWLHAAALLAISGYYLVRLFTPIAA